jgi:beta-lactam-binding protein with PASTA domain
MVNLVGQREAAALALLNAQGLTLTSRKEEYVKDRAGWVLSQKPEAGAPVRRGDGVSLVVGASGMVRVPAVIGLSLDDARKVLKKAGLATGRITRVTVAHEKAGLVLEQKPDAGADLDRGATVALSVGARDDDSQSDGSGGSGDHKILVRIARQAEEKLREAGIGDTAPKDYVAVRLKEAGVKDRAALDRFVSLDRTKVRDFLGMRTLAETDRIIAALRKARGEIDD